MGIGNQGNKGSNEWISMTVKHHTCEKDLQFAALFKIYSSKSR